MRHATGLVLENLGKAILRPSLCAMAFVAIIHEKVTIFGSAPN